MKPKIVIYSTPICPYCNRAKEFLKSYNLEYQDINIMNNPELAQKVFNDTGLKTVPQIYINDIHVGGWDDLKMLDQQGKLQNLLSDIHD